MDRYPDEVDATGVELLEDRTIKLAAPRHAGHARRLGTTVPGALAGTFLVAALAFGAARGPGLFDGSQTAGNGSEQEATPEATKAPKPDQAPAATKAPSVTTTYPKDEPKPSPKETAPEPAPEPLPIEIGVALADGKPVVEWSACAVDGFKAWKVIRSTDDAATYPKGPHDGLVGVIEDEATRRFADKKAPTGLRLWFRVYAVGANGIACVSDIGSVEVPEPEPVPKPEPKPEPKPQPEVGALGLTLKLAEGHPYVDWSACDVDGFDAYKVVRSKDATATWPAGDKDEVVAAVGPDGKTAFYDKHAPAGRTLWYRVFCVDKVDGEYVVRAASAVRAIETPEAPEPEPLPEPTVMGFELDSTGEGVVLGWEACASEHFLFYKVVRASHDNPSYLPGTDGSQVIAVIENASDASWVDGVDGGTWFYRIQAIGWYGDQKVLLGQTAVLSVTVE